MGEKCQLSQKFKLGIQRIYCDYYSITVKMILLNNQKICYSDAFYIAYSFLLK